MENRIIIKNMSDALYKIIPRCSDSSTINHISKNKFSYTNNTDITRYYLVFKSYNAYKKNITDISHKMYKSNGFYIAELF